MRVSVDTGAGTKARCTAHFEITGYELAVSKGSRRITFASKHGGLELEFTPKEINDLKASMQ